ncbi:hypothetical protein M407DRAFT_241047 [Tulasnella calospora MUT 4182]|uniref:Uncharacterized protein n=1 Tax=Tulasnella calospora MUT 4182 TaxID=1051891 RepID=A0A0C3QV74_9AGAM|nr:hypothetical protein M407DRAFT_241047 [Tulasnella calospora MUT 4182]
MWGIVHWFEGQSSNARVTITPSRALTPSSDVSIDPYTCLDLPRLFTKRAERTAQAQKLLGATTPKSNPASWVTS